MALLYSIRHRFEEFLFHSACQAGGIVMWRVILVWSMAAYVGACRTHNVSKL